MPAVRAKRGPALLIGLLLGSFVFSPASAHHSPRHTNTQIKQARTLATQARSLATSALRAPFYSQSPATPLPAGQFTSLEGGCPGGGNVLSGGASAGGTDAISIFESYPSDANPATANAAGRTGWTVTLGNFATTTVNVHAYMICAAPAPTFGDFAPGQPAVSKRAMEWTVHPVENV